MAAAKAIVASAETLLLQELRRHARLRHPGLRNVSSQEHARDHRLNGEQLDHVHRSESER